MHGTMRAEVAGATKIGGHARHPVESRDTRVPFGKVAKALWPRKTAATLASIGGKDERTAKRWLSGEYEPPGVVIAAIVNEITKRG